MGVKKTVGPKWEGEDGEVSWTVQEHYLEGTNHSEFVIEVRTPNLTLRTQYATRHPTEWGLEPDDHQEINQRLEHLLSGLSGGSL